MFWKKDGSGLTVDFTSRPIIEDGKITGAVVTFKDITDRKQAEDAIKESEVRFRTMAEAMPQLAWMAHADGFIYWYNRRWYEYTGTSS